MRIAVDVNRSRSSCQGPVPASAIRSNAPVSASAVLSSLAVALEDLPGLAIGDRPLERLVEPEIDHGGGNRRALPRDLHIGVGVAAQRLGVSRVMLSRLLNGRSAMSADMAIRIGLLTRTSPESWLANQV